MHGTFSWAREEGIGWALFRARWLSPPFPLAWLPWNPPCDPLTPELSASEPGPVRTWNVLLMPPARQPSGPGRGESSLGV
jgi:hypothetical protein